MNSSNTRLNGGGALTAVAVYGLLFPSPSQPDEWVDPTPYTVEDMFRVQSAGALTFSPDGSHLAYIAQELGGLRSSVRVVSITGDTLFESTPISSNPGDGIAGWTIFGWSPAGNQLLLGAHSGGEMELYIWHSDSGLERSVSRFEKPMGYCFWISNGEAACVLREAISSSAAKIAIRAWEKFSEGQVSTASVIDTKTINRDNSVENRDMSPGIDQLVLIDTRAGRSRTVLEERIALVQPSMSPEGRYLAIATSVSPGNDEYRLTIIDLLGENVLAPLDGVTNIELHSLSWSPDGSKIAVLGISNAQAKECSRGYPHPACPKDLFVYDVEAQEAAPVVSSEDLRVEHVLWSMRGQLLARADSATDLQVHRSDATSTRMDWWLVRPNEASFNITRKMHDVPKYLVESHVSDSEPASFFGLANESLWRIRIGGESVSHNRVDHGTVDSFESILWPINRFGSRNDSAPRTTRHLIALVQAAGEDRLVYVDLDSGNASPFVETEQTAKLSTVSPLGDAVLLDVESDSSYWLARIDKAPSLVFDTNPHLRGVSQGQIRKLDYMSQEGQHLNGWYILPAEYKLGKRYPLVVSVYAGTEHLHEQPPYGSQAKDFSFLNLQILAGRGYVVLMPSMPLSRIGYIDDPYTRLTHGVMPAIDKLTAMEIVDSDRVAVMGHSFGGYSTMGLITQSDRFRAAVSIAGISDLVSNYGTLAPNRRYAQSPNFYVPPQAVQLSENGQIRMGGPPWSDLKRYVRNSPITYVDNVRTPILLIHGDMDGVPIQQSEQFFVSLLRQDKRARFVRYWGEGHTISSPANIRDMWHRIFGWLDEYLGEPNP